MRWNKKIPKVKAKRSHGCERTRTYFAITPKIINDEWVWLEWYKSICVWLPNDPEMITHGFIWEFSHRETIDKDRVNSK